MIRLFELQGYELCQGAARERGFEKVALYLDESRFGFMHVARQLRSGVWLSKLGDIEDIEHQTLGALEGDQYGKVQITMRRPLL